MGKSVEISVKAQPGAARAEVVGWHAGALKLRVTAAPERGRANRALCELLAARCGVSRGAVSVVRGAGARLKSVRIEGLDAADLERLFGAP